MNRALMGRIRVVPARLRKVKARKTWRLSLVVPIARNRSSCLECLGRERSRSVSKTDPRYPIRIHHVAGIFGGCHHPNRSLRRTARPFSKDVCLYIQMSTHFEAEIALSTEGRIMRRHGVGRREGTVGDAEARIPWPARRRAGSGWRGKILVAPVDNIPR